MRIPIPWKDGLYIETGPSNRMTRNASMNGSQDTHTTRKRTVFIDNVNELLRSWS